MIPFSPPKNAPILFSLASTMLTFILFSGCGQVQEMAKNAGDSIKKASDEIAENVKEEFSSAKKDIEEAAKPNSGNGSPKKDIPYSEPKADAPSSSPKGKIANFIKLGSSNVKDRDLIELSNDPAAAALLTELKLSSAGITVESLKVLKKFPNLTVLEMLRISCLPGNMQHINAVKSLTVLDVAFNPLTDRDFAEINGLSNLKEINIGGTNITDEGFKCFKDMPNLEVMRMDRMGGLYGKGFKYVSKNSLKEIYANGSSIGQFGFTSLGGSESLEVLWLNGAKVTDKAMVGIGRCGNLKVLNLQRNDLTNEGVKKLERLPKLEEIVLAGNLRLSNVALGSLSKIKTLKLVNVNKTQCSPTLKDEFLKRVPGCKLIF